MLKKLAVGMLFIAGTANAAGFDCAKAYSKVEKLICDTPSLSKADDELYVDYLQAKLVTGDSAEFKKIVSQNWKLREKNCDTEQCLLDWYKRSTELYRNIAGSKNISSPTSGCYEEGQQVTLSGTLERTVFPGPPNYESVESGDKPETYWTLNTRDPIKCAKGSADWGKKDQFQLIVSGDFYKENEKYLGGKVSVTGKLAYSETGHHHTPIMINVDSIKALSASQTVSNSHDNYGLPIPKNKTAFNNFNKVMTAIMNSDDVASLTKKKNLTDDDIKLMGVLGPVSSIALYYEYKKNEIVANNKYKGKKVRVYGMVDSISEDFTGGGVVKTASPDMFLGGALLNVNKKDPYVLSLTPGAEVDMVCTGGGFIMDSPVLRECVASKNYSDGKSKSERDAKSLKKAMPYILYMSSEKMIEKQCSTMTECSKYEDLAAAFFAAGRNGNEDNKRRLMSALNAVGLTQDEFANLNNNMGEFIKRYEKQLERKFNTN